MHFRKRDKVSLSLAVALTAVFALFFLGGGFLRNAEPPRSPAPTETQDPVSVAEPSAVEPTSVPDRVFEKVAVSCLVTVPDGYGAVREETREEKIDFAASDGRCTAANKTLTSLSPDLDRLLASFSPAAGEKTVLLYHTHTSEGYASSADGLYRLGKDGLTDTPDANGVVAVGDALAEELTKRGIRVIHLRDTFDSPSRSGSFTRSRAAAEKILAEETVDLAIDLHRGVIQQSGGDRVKPTVTVNGAKAAQITLIGYAFAEETLPPTLAVQHALLSLSPHLCLPVSLGDQEYNFSLPAPCLMAEIGTDVNTLPEAQRAARLLGEAIAAALQRKNAE